MVNSKDPKHSTEEKVGSVREALKTDAAGQGKPQNRPSFPVLSPEEWEDLGLEVEDELVIHFKSR